MFIVSLSEQIDLRGIKPEQLCNNPAGPPVTCQSACYSRRAGPEAGVGNFSSLVSQGLGSVASDAFGAC